MPHPPVQLGSATPNLGGAVVPQGNPGLAVKAMADVSAAVKILEGALPNIPIGSPLHSEVLNSTKSLIKHLQDGGESNPQEQIMSLLNMARSAAQAQPMQALMRMQGGGPNQAPVIGAPAGGAPPSPLARAA